MKLIIYIFIYNNFKYIRNKTKSENPCYNLYDFDYESSQMIIFI